MVKIPLAALVLASFGVIVDVTTEAVAAEATMMVTLTTTLPEATATSTSLYSTPAAMAMSRRIASILLPV